MRKDSSRHTGNKYTLWWNQSTERCFGVFFLSSTYLLTKLVSDLKEGRCWNSVMIIKIVVSASFRLVFSNVRGRAQSAVMPVLPQIQTPTTRMISAVRRRTAVKVLSSFFKSNGQARACTHIAALETEKQHLWLLSGALFLLQFLHWWYKKQWTYCSVQHS